MMNAPNRPIGSLLTRIIKDKEQVFGKPVYEREKLSKKGTRAPKETSKQASLRAKTCLSLFLRALGKCATGLTNTHAQEVKNVWLR